MARRSRPKVEQDPDLQAKTSVDGSEQQSNAKTAPSKSRSRKQVTAASVVTDPEKTAEEITTHTVAFSRKRKIKAEEQDTTTITIPKKRKVKVEDEEPVKPGSSPGPDSKDTVSTSEQIGSISKKARQKVKAEQKPEDGQGGDESGTKVKRRRKTKEEKEAAAMPLAARTLGHKLYIGAHVSASGGVHKAVLNSVHIGANAFALFLKSQRKWTNPALADDVATMFHANCKTHTYDASSHIVPHGSYLVNLAHTDPERTKQAYDSFLDDLQRCEKLGIKLYNLHPGNSVGNDRAAAIKHLASNLNRSHKATKSVVTLLENMAAGGNIIGTTFEDLRDIIKHVEDKSRIGVCLDTCHAFAAGYDLRSPEAFNSTLQHFDEIVGMKYLRAMHLNDSKAPFESHRDLHANIGTGFLGLRAFHNIVNEPRLVGLPLVLETPTTNTDGEGEPLKDEKGKVNEDPGTWAREIKLLESMVDMDVQGEEFLALEAALARKGAKERERIGDQAARRKEKDAKKAAKDLKKSQKQHSEESELSELDDD